MATRIVFLPKNIDPWFEEKIVEFEWVPGMAVSQAQKSITNMHESIKSQLNLENPLEISTRSELDIGVSLSAFNLRIEDFDGTSFSVESCYQSSKVFTNGGPFKDLIHKSSSEAKKDERLKNSGKLIGFNYENREWKITNSPNFYDYLYISALIQNEIRKNLINYDCFTDIAFSQTSKNYKTNLSFNCQARSASIYLGLLSKYSDKEIINELLKITLNNSDEITEAQLTLDF